MAPQLFLIYRPQYYSFFFIPQNFSIAYFLPFIKTIDL